MSFLYSKGDHPKFTIVHVFVLLWLNLLVTSSLYAEPPRVLHTTFEQYAKQQQQHDQQLMGSQSAKPTAKVSGAKVSSKSSSQNNIGMAVNINQADELGLAAALIGVGPAKAKAIIEYRKQNGAFKRVDDLVLVKGIGPATLEKNRDRLRLN